MQLKYAAQSAFITPRQKEQIHRPWALTKTHSHHHCRASDCDAAATSFLSLVPSQVHHHHTLLGGSFLTTATQSTVRFTGTSTITTRAITSLQARKPTAPPRPAAAIARAPTKSRPTQSLDGLFPTTGTSGDTHLAHTPHLYVTRSPDPPIGPALYPKSTAFAALENSATQEVLPLPKGQLAPARYERER